MKDLFDVEQLTQFEFGAIVLTVLIAGLVLGCLIAWGLLNRKNSPNAVAAAKIQEEFEEYKEKVDDHFSQTSEMFKDVTTQYKKLYDHMAVGAVSLGNADTITMPRLEMQDTEKESAADTIITSEDIVEQNPGSVADSDTSTENQAEETSEQIADESADRTREENKTS